jgi:ABC-type Fe3+-hydroxamate transport system substrate-binding protein
VSVHFTDQLGRTVELASVPERIVSLVPSQTELLYHLGLQRQVAGITKFCVHPEEWFRTKTRVGGTKTVKMDIIHQLNPDLVIANKEENVAEQVEEIARHYPVWVSDINNLDDSLEMISQVGSITNTSVRATELIYNIQAAFGALTTYNLSLKTGYLIWRDPYMTAGGDTFIHDMLTRCGLQNIFASLTRYPAVTIEQLQCDLLLLSSEPYPFKEKHIAELQQYLPRTKILLVDGEFFSWYGSRLLEAPAYFEQLLKEAYPSTSSG